MIKGFLVGVNNYNNYKNLYICYNDALLFRKSLIDGLHVSGSNITTIGESGNVNRNKLSLSVSEFMKNVESDDIVFIYFSGHGVRKDGKSYLVVTDGLIELSQWLDSFNLAISSTQIVIIDSCFSGGFEFEHSVILEYESKLRDFIGKGRAIFASSRGYEESAVADHLRHSKFTDYLCFAINSKFDIRKGMKSLSDIVSLTQFLLNRDYKLNPEEGQNSVYRSNIGGGLEFKVYDYKAYETERYMEESDEYIIKEVQPLHANVKRYCAIVLLKYDMGIPQLAKTSHRIIDKVKRLEVYKNKPSEIRFFGKRTNIVWIHFGLDEADLQGNFKYIVTWVDESQDKAYWYKSGDDRVNYNGLSIRIMSNYNWLHEYKKENTMSVEETIQSISEARIYLIEIAEKILYKYQKFSEGEINEISYSNFIDRIAADERAIKGHYDGIGIPANDLAEYDQLHRNLFATIDDMILFYSNSTKETWKPLNRENLMKEAINRYEKDLISIKDYENEFIDDV